MASAEPAINKIISRDRISNSESCAYAFAKSCYYGDKHYGEESDDKANLGTSHTGLIADKFRKTAHPKPQYCDCAVRLQPHEEAVQQHSYRCAGDSKREFQNV